jgi:hypothetical protein
MNFEMVTINYWAVLISAVASMVIGSIWYGPLFGKMFMSAMGMDKLSPEQQAGMKKAMGMTYFIQFLASLLTFCVLAWLMSALGASTAMNGVQVAFWVWLGFVMPVQLGQQLWGGKMKLFWLGTGNMLLTLLAAGIIIGAMK